MKKKLNPFNFIILIPILLFVLLMLSILSIIAYPYYSNIRIHTETNASNSIVSVEDITQKNSVIYDMSDENTAGFDCTLAKGDDDPVCRLGIWINNDKFKGLDLSKFNSIKVYGNFITPNTHDFVRISLRNYEPSVTSDDIEDYYKFNLVEVQVSEITQPIQVDFKRLIVPNWWLAQVSDQNIKSEVDLTNITLIEIATANQNSLGDYKFRVSAIELHKQVFTIEKLYEYLLMIWALFFLLIFIAFTIYLGFKTNQKFHNERILLEINRSLSKRSEKLEITHKTDELTSVLNRNGMKEKMLDCLSHNWFPLSAVMIDIDFFKKINDRFGHQKGDEVLVNLGKILNDFVENNESVSRYGGEEFILLLPTSETESIKVRLETLRQTIQSSDLGTGHTVTASFGVATSSKKTDFNDLVEKADKALYEAKENGRNCIIYAK